MRVGRLIARRIGLAVVSMYVVMTVAFAFIAATPDPNVNVIQYSAALELRYAPPEERLEYIRQQVEAYRQARNLDVPVWKRYVRWLAAVSTFDWGLSKSTNVPVTMLIRQRLPFTLAYVVPSMVLSTVGGIALGSYLALRDGKWLDRTGRTAAYVGFGLPSFWLAVVLLHYATELYMLPGDYYIQMDAGVDPTTSPLAAGNLLGIALAAIVLTTTLFASQLRHARSETLEHVGSEFIRLARAKGLARVGVARHALRVAAVPLLSLFFVDLFGVLVVSVVVIEYVLELPGFGLLTFSAIRTRDLPLVLGTTMVVAFVGIVGTMLKDVISIWLDPRVEEF